MFEQNSNLNSKQRRALRRQPVLAERRARAQSKQAEQVKSTLDLFAQAGVDPTKVLAKI